MGSDHAEIWQQAPPPPIKNFDALVQHPAPDHNLEKPASEDMLLLGMMLWMQQGCVLEWVNPGKEKEVAEEPTPAKKQESPEV